MQRGRCWLRAALQLRSCTATTPLAQGSASLALPNSDGTPAVMMVGRQLWWAAPQPTCSQPSALLQPARGFTAAAATLLAAGKQRGDADAHEPAAAAAAAATDAPPPGAEGAAAEGEEEEEEEEEVELDGEAAVEAMNEAFERLIYAALEMVQQGKPMEAEYVLTEGARQAEEILGANALELAALYDQLCVVCFLYERVEEATRAAKRALEIVRHHDDGFGPATAIAATRYASTLLAAGSPQEAQMYAAQSVLCLEEGMEVLAKMRADGEEDEELIETLEKFGAGLGESRYYEALAKQAQELEDEGGVGRHLATLTAGLEGMRGSLGPESPLVAAALREHSRLVMAALEADKLDLAESLYLQDAKLHVAAGGSDEQVALTLYQCGTLQYVMGKYSEAAESLQQSLDAVRKHNPLAEEHLLTVQQRLGTVLALLGEHERAKAMLLEVAPALVANLGEGNPASEELSFTLALIALRQLAAEGGGGADPESRRQHLADMERHLEQLAGYGEDHMLVTKARGLLHAEKEAAAVASSGS